MKDFDKYLKISTKVREALDNNQPIVALESTIIAHGMPYPDNIETALEVERIIDSYGVVPATIGIINGKIVVGLDGDEIEYLGKSKNVLKASRRDLPVILSKGFDAATTVSATMICADLAGIKVFVTGGIGGVHRGGENTLDVSADLTELSQTNVAVVCAGAKSILDIGLTLEKLETLGVPVLGYKTISFPAFYNIDSGHRCDYEMDSTEEIAKAMIAKWNLGLKGGIVIANPIPEEYEIDSDYINEAIKSALMEADKLNIKGKETTPYLLGKIKSITGNRSLLANIELVYNNARIGAQIARDYNRLR
ncbi:MAG: pseudouridine-5'-phosphate glycosidase [Eubacteriales bacterium]|nr:pseudouridine-5'-phosphate glycosidase [Eubacteriales bacterium]